MSSTISFQYPYCSVECQKFDWLIHKRVCAAIALRGDEEADGLVEPNNVVEEDGGSGSGTEEINKESKGNDKGHGEVSNEGDNHESIESKNEEKAD